MFRHHQEIDRTGRVRSVQTLDLPSAQSPTPAAAAEAGLLYWDFLRRFGRGALRVTAHTDDRITVGVPGLRLLDFSPPSIVAYEGGFAARYGITEGAVVQKAGRGQGHLQIGLGSRQVSLAVEGYHAALVGPKRHPVRVGFYLATQSLLHVAVARGFLGLLARRLRA